MPKTRIGLDIGSTAVRVAEVTVADVPAVVRVAQVPLVAGAVESGEVRQPEVVADALRELWTRSGIRGRRVHLGVGNQRVVVREIILPWLPDKELRASLGFQVQEFIPMSVEEAVLDFDPLGEMDQGGRRMLRLLLVAAHKGMIGALVEAVTSAKLEPISIDLTPFAVSRAVGTGDEGLDLEETQGDEAVVEVGGHITTICVHARGVTRFVRILPTGGREVTLAIARGLGIEEDLAEELKRGEVPEGVADLPDMADVRRVAIQRAGSFVDEIRSSLEFYAAQVPGARISRVLVTGGGSKLEGFLDLLLEKIPVTVDRGHVFEPASSELDLDQDILDEAEPVLAVPVGLAISDRGRA
jgi:type IV pilus assembly protein PilM